MHARRIKFVAMVSTFALPFSAVDAQQITRSTDVAVAKPTPAAASAPTSVPALVPYSGFGMGADGKPITGDASVTLLIYKDEVGGEPLFSELQTAAFDATGHYAVQLGATLSSGIPIDLFGTGEARWLEVQIAGAKTQPRALLVSVPYALKAGDASTLGGLPASAYVLAGSSQAQAINSLAAVTSAATTAVTTTGGTSGIVPVYSGTSSIINSGLYYSSGSLGIGKVPAAALDVSGISFFEGQAVIEKEGTATASASYPSHSFQFQSSAYNSSSKVAVSPYFELSAEPSGNNTASPTASLHFLAGTGTGAASDTGLSISSKGIVTFASGQTFPAIGAGSGTITGVTAGTGLTGGGTTGKVTLSVNTSVLPTLTGNNTYTGSNVFKSSLYTDTDMNVDNGNANSGGNSPGVRFGNASGEGIASQRVSGGDNQYGLDFFTDYARVMSIAENGYIGMGTTGIPGITLSVQSGTNDNAGYFQSEQNAATLYVENDSSNQEPAVYALGQDGSCSMDNRGNLDCEGSVSGSSKNFKIDDPLDPANKYLVHASVESSEMMNIYSGNVTTDQRGIATVTLPDWFEAENGDFRYQLTTIGRDAHAWVSQEVSNKQFQITTNATNVKVSWQITAVRQDGFAKAHPLVAEQNKPANEVGLYRHPEFFGQPKEKAIRWAINPKRIAASKAAGVAKNTLTKTQTP